MTKRILVVEDDMALKPLWEIIAKRNMGGMKLDWSVSGEEGRRLLSQVANEKKKKYDLVVTDLFLAGSETGLDFVKYVRVSDPSVPIFLVTSVDETDLKKHYGKDLDNISVLEKPLSVAQFERALETLIS